MLRDLLSSRWFQGGLAFCVLIVGGSLLYSWHLDRTTESDMERHDQFLQRVKQNKKRPTETVNVPTGTETPGLVDTPEENEATQPRSDETEAGPNETESLDITDAFLPDDFVSEEEVPAEDVAVSPFGFGPYPEVPADYRSVVVWLQSDYDELPTHAQKNFELIHRVLIKLWASGEKGFRGASTYKGKVYPHYYNTVYVGVSEYELPNGKKVQYISRRKSGPHVDYNGVDLLNPPPHIRVLDIESSGIDPYQYLELP